MLFSDIRNYYFDIQNNYIGYPKYMYVRVFWISKIVF